MKRSTQNNLNRSAVRAHASEITCWSRTDADEEESYVVRTTNVEIRNMRRTVSESQSGWYRVRVSVKPVHWKLTFLMMKIACNFPMCRILKFSFFLLWNVFISDPILRRFPVAIDMTKPISWSSCDGWFTRKFWHHIAGEWRGGKLNFSSMIIAWLWNWPQPIVKLCNPTGAKWKYS